MSPAFGIGNGNGWWAPPRQVAWIGLRTLDALGTTLFTAVKSAPPFARPNAAAVMAAVLLREPASCAWNRPDGTFLNVSANRLTRRDGHRKVSVDRRGSRSASTMGIAEIVRSGAVRPRSGGRSRGVEAADR